MELKPIKAIVEGRYYWELVFRYDNESNNREIEHKTKITKSKKVNVKQMLTKTFNIRHQFAFENKVSASLKFLKLIRASGSTNFNYHLDIAHELTRTSVREEETSEESVVERNYTIGGGGKLSLYRLCYSTDGVIVKTDIVATSPKNDVFVELEFAITKYILGLSEIFERFLNTYPRTENKGEWRTIRESIIEVSDEPDEKAFLHFVKTLSRIKPLRDNQGEWADIRTTCSEILADWKTEEEKQLLFKKLLTRFRATRPGRSNSSEWAAICSVSDSILRSMKQIF